MTATVEVQADRAVRIGVAREIAARMMGDDLVDLAHRHSETGHLQTAPPQKGLRQNVLVISNAPRCCQAAAVDQSSCAKVAGIMRLPSVFIPMTFQPARR